MNNSHNSYEKNNYIWTIIFFHMPKFGDDINEEYYNFNFNIFVYVYFH